MRPASVSRSQMSKPCRKPWSWNMCSSKKPRLRPVTLTTVLREAMRSVYKDHDPNQTATWFAQVKQSFDSDPIAATAWAAEQYGLTPLQLAQQIYQRYGQQQNQPTQQDVARADGHRGASLQPKSPHGRACGRYCC